MTTDLTKDWAEDEEGWDMDSGNPGIMLIAKAIQVWSHMQQKPVPISKVAAAFNITASSVEQAVDAHPYMFIKQGIIEHDGE